MLLCNCVKQYICTWGGGGFHNEFGDRPTKWSKPCCFTFVEMLSSTKQLTNYSYIHVAATLQQAITLKKTSFKYNTKR